jgi:hypothetical protein
MIATETLDREALAEDLGNIVFLEHVNVTITDPLQATLFYIVGLGFTRDPYMTVGIDNMWVNIGGQQLHLPTNPQPMVLRGHTGFVVPNLDAVKQNLEKIEPRLAGTKFSWADRGDSVEAVSPWGNVCRCYAPGAFGPMRLGMPYVELAVPPGAADGIGRFYQQVFGATTDCRQDAAGTAAFVDAGANQQLIFREAEQVPEYDGHHVAIYIQNFSGPFQKLQERGLIGREIRNHQFRFDTIVDPDSGEKLYQLEHEVRSMKHPGYRRVLVNRGTGDWQ